MEKVYRKATMADLDAIGLIYDHIHDAEESGKLIVGWERGVYPTRSTAEVAIERGEMFVCEVDGAIPASAILNKTQVDVYYGADWEYEADDDEVFVLHTLVVDPACAKGGIGRGFVAYYEELARELGCKVLRMDTNERNAVARKLYSSLGYREAGIVPTVFNGIEGVGLVLLEKKL